MRSVIRFAAFLFLLMGTSSCGLLSGRCLYEIRNVVASGSVVTSGTDSAYAQLIESEQRDYEPDKNFSWQILGPALKGHVQRIVLLESAATSAARYDFPLHPETVPALSTGFVRKSEGADLDGMFDILSTFTAVLRMTTDIPGKATITIPLNRIQRNDWSRPYCS